MEPKPRLLAGNSVAHAAAHATAAQLEPAVELTRGLCARLKALRSDHNIIASFPTFEAGFLKTFDANRKATWYANRT